MTVSLLVGGCASQNAPSWVAGPPVRVAEPSARVEVEADGLPSQIAPRNRQPDQDDPREPWSPNYGRTPAEVASAQGQGLDTRRLAAKLDAGNANSLARSGVGGAVTYPAVQPASPRPLQRTASQMNVPSPGRFFQPNLRPMDPDEIIRRAIAAHEMRRSD